MTRPSAISMLDVTKRLFLRLGDHVYHSVNETWGRGVVVEVMTSIVPGGTCLVRILFEDGQQRTFNNDMDSDLCCCYRGMRKHWRLGFATSAGQMRSRVTARLNGPR